MRPLTRVWISSLCDWSIALEISARCACRAIDCKRVSILRGDNPLCAPSANERVSYARHVLTHEPPLAERQLPNTAGMKNIGDIVTAECVIPEITKPWKRWRAIEYVPRDTENVFVIILAHRSGVISQHIQALFESALKSDLHRVVISCSVRVQVVTVLREV